jgi:hypothetical protein
VSFHVDSPPAEPTSVLRRLVEPLILRGGPSNSRVHMDAVTYRNVYRHKNGYRAQFKWFGNQKKLPTRPTAFEAAVLLARWYERVLGPGWAENLLGKVKLKSWKVEGVPWLVRHSGKLGGYVVAVWVEGVRKDVVRLRRGRWGEWFQTGRLAVYSSHQRAVEGMAVWLVRVYGPALNVLVWRHPPPASSPAGRESGGV